MATLKQVAAHAEVSVQTVSNALNAPHRLRPDTLERVTRSIELLNYRPNRNARSLRTSAVELIGYCVPSWPDGQAHLVMDQFLHALCTAAENTGRHILLFTAPTGLDGMPVYDDLHARRLVDGFVLSQTETHDPRHGWLKEQRIPFVSFGRVWQQTTQPGPYVDVDGASGCATATRHLAETGRRRIGFLGWPRTSGLAEDRLSGWRRACQQLGLPTDGLAVHCPEDTLDAGADATAELLDATEPVDGIVALSDVLALGALRELARRGLTAGTDVGLTGFDDSPLASVVSPALTSLRQPMDRIATALIAILTATPGDGAEPAAPADRLLQPELVIRGSSAPG
ncbi:transcriptional regulator, LacI family [Kribbella flavida DSM 17836]|uniref:Transcriptional regulator, LacI family n=1 Tax=Kribbella flavida (strain DSM 17836 / JCM 10339 / NBRC 14399) TaxID=479435 RepID=D2PRE4_KRIFD|nr:LacI family DNA-binding transcriptional regulator [Kribbella flavida]ADB34862.1 transcriptional regulator, LacI family [Kribbella flavida DSM 17836]